jgi:hypothetical protein
MALYPLNVNWLSDFDAPFLDGGNVIRVGWVLVLACFPTNVYFDFADSGFAVSDLVKVTAMTDPQKRATNPSSLLRVELRAYYPKPAY